MYRSRYSHPNKAEGDYWILDNGAAEGKMISDRDLIKLADWILADELVMPDTLNNADRTLELSRLFAVQFDKMSQRVPALAGVVQGRNPAEWMKCLNAYFFWEEFRHVKTIMFPRCMNTDENKHWRFQYLEALFKSSQWEDLNSIKKVEVHCLGAYKWVREVAALSELPIRSMDTSLPVVLGLEGIRIKTNAYVKRQSDFFEIKGVPDSLLEVINDNVRTYLDWAGAEAGEAAPAREV